MSILRTKPVRQYQNYIKTKSYPEHTLVLQRYQDIKYSKYKNHCLSWSEMRIPTALGFITIEHNTYDTVNIHFIEISMVFVKSSIRYSITDNKPRVVIEEI